jgi:hypothetical protein
MKPENLQQSNETREKEISPEIVQEVENSRYGLSIENPHPFSVDKINILLVASGLKPASDVRFSIREENGVTGNKFELSEKEIEENLSLLKKLGIYFIQPKRKVEESRWRKGAKKEVTESEEIEILIGHTQEELDLLVKAWGTGDHRALGRALGFAPTAIEAFAKGDKLDESIMPREIQTSEAMNFNPGRLSADHWQEELEYYQKWAEYIRRVSPNLYDQMIILGTRKFIDREVKKSST